MTARRSGADEPDVEPHAGRVVRPEFDWHNPGFGQADDDPVACVSWLDATDYAANAFGVHDMLGNVREWVAD